ncbi:MAG: hypothetical protein JHC57_18580 [Sphingopyxis sp.]|uniref:hypothetical protein n=1 Tax=Sphingopyxis sp. TaxID=1908224 RepID=UPI001A2C9FD7|nr:hypothetical protein [Sphingopyxis sp.]MBJ7501767.1 hypothetical protein [Sphingopyxis sp.]
MRAFHLMLLDDASSSPRRVDFRAEGPDHAFQIARNETDGINVELWEGESLLARMTKTAANVWKLLPSSHESSAENGVVSKASAPRSADTAHGL